MLLRIIRLHMRKFFFIFVLFCFITNLLYAIDNAESKVKSRAEYKAMRPQLNEDNVRHAVTDFLYNQTDEKAFHICMAAYICGHEPIRVILRTYLGNIEGFIALAEHIDKGDEKI